MKLIHYTRADFLGNLKGNIFGGITAGIVALPLALAFGIASGAGPVAGLYGAIILGFFAAIFGGTPSQISGPTGPMTVVMTAVIAKFMAQHPDQGMALAFTTVVLGGVLQALMGVFRLGRYIVMVPYPVISGFMTGIGVIIIFLQLPVLIGVPSSGGVLGALNQFVTHLPQMQSDAVLVGLASLGVIFLWRGRFAHWLPAPLLALIVGTLLIYLINPNSPIDRIGEIPRALPHFQWPTFAPDVIPDMLAHAAMLAILGSIDSLLTSLVADNITGTRHDSDRELIGQGIGNTLAGLFGGLPGAGATMRTVVNVRAGGTGPLSGVIHALLLLAVALGLGFMFEGIPQAVLAGILVKVGIDIIDWPFLKRFHRLPAFTVFLTLLVLVLTVFVDLMTAVFIGVFIKNLVTLDKLSDLELGSVIISDGEHLDERLPQNEKQWLSSQGSASLLIRITGPISYAVGRRLLQRTEQFKGHRNVIIDLTSASLIGISTAMILEEIINKAKANGANVFLLGVHGKTKEELNKIGLLELVGISNIYDYLAGLQAHL